MAADYCSAAMDDDVVQEVAFNYVWIQLPVVQTAPSRITYVRVTLTLRAQSNLCDAPFLSGY
jgi:hypothetical protein